jgi:uncharacterized NAD(P)/FAD-binding protein YdhS
MRVSTLGLKLDMKRLTVRIMPSPILGNPYHVAVIGAGASGTLVAAQFNKLARPDAKLVLIGSQSKPALGVAYETAFQANLLNVPAGNMSAFPDDMKHFVNWLKARLPDSNAGTFAPRKIYGDYLSGIFENTLNNSDRIAYFNDTATRLTRKDDKWIVHFDNDTFLESNSIVLALGNLLLPSNPIDFSDTGSAYHLNPWSSEISKDLKADAPVLLIGTGLTMVDAALSLREDGHRGPIHAISRHGRLYQTHKPYQARPLLSLPQDFSSPVGALRWIRREVKVAEQSGSDWRAVIDSLRPHTSTIWNLWNQVQHASFLCHARNLWDIHRHRVAPKISDQLSALMESGTLFIHTGKLISANSNGNDVTVEWQDAGTGRRQKLNVARIINCTGPSRDITRIQSPLMIGLLTDGWITPDPLQLGPQTNAQGHLLNANGQASPNLYAIGPLRIASLWESIAIPEIRNQAVELSELLVSESLESSVLA